MDLQQVCHYSKVRACCFVLNDMDPDAIQAAKSAVNGKAGRMVFIAGNALEVSGQIASHGPFDLIITGGLFDYLDHRAAKLFVQFAFAKWLRGGGRFYFSNIAKGNPYRYWMEYLEDWPLLERNESDVHALLQPVEKHLSTVSITRDPTGLTLLVVAKRRAEQPRQ